jgi:hypothetical protein
MQVQALQLDSRPQRSRRSAKMAGASEMAMQEVDVIRQLVQAEER